MNKRKTTMKEVWAMCIFVLGLLYLPQMRRISSAHHNIIGDEEINDDAPDIVVRNKKRSVMMPENPRIYLIHVGKAGGSTLVRALKLIDTIDAVKCMVNITRVGGSGTSSCYRHPPGVSKLTRSTFGFFHLEGVALPKEGRKWLLDNTNVFLFTVRDPIARLISAYSYHRYEYSTGSASQFPRLAKFYTQCFPGRFDSMIDDIRNGTSVECSRMGVNALLGKIRNGGAHFQFNYEYYLKYTLGQRPNHAVAVVRTEHMWEDVIHLDQGLGGTGNYGKMDGFKFTHGSENFTVLHSTGISTSNTVFLCCLISREIEVYQQMILKALNLDDERKRETLNDLLGRCLITPDEKDVLQHPFSWRAFRQGEICRSPLSNLSDSLSAPTTSNKTPLIVVRDKNASNMMPENPRIYLIHVGKAGGSTLVRALRLIDTTRAVKCMVNETRVGGGGTSSCYRHPPGVSQLTRRTLGFFHLTGALDSKEGRKWLLDNTNVFLFAVRDPIARLISAYNYHRHEYSNVTKFPSHAKYYTACFPGSFDSMIDDIRNGTSVECSEMGVNALLGKIRTGGIHFEFNYEHYLNYTLSQRPNHAVAVVRTEHMWEDVIHLDQVLGGTGNYGKMEGFKFTHGSENFTVPHSTDISTSNTVFLCCLISREMVVYQQIILKALNLDDEQKRETLNDLLGRCLITPDEKDVLQHPFSWRAFRQGEICSDPLSIFSVRSAPSQ